MVAKVYTIASGKGGTGKTTSTVNIGTALSMLGKKTIIIDADIGMANLGLVLGLERSPITLHEVLAGKANIEQAVYEGPSGLKVVPSGISLQGFQESDPERLQEVMVKLLEGIDFMIIDAPAGISRDGIIPLAVADEVLLIVNPEISSMADALKTKILTETVGGKVGGAILNRAGVDQTELKKQKVTELLGVEVIDVIPEDGNVRRSAAFKIPVVLRSPNSASAFAYRRIAAKLAGQAIVEVENTTREGFVGRLARAIFGGK